MYLCKSGPNSSNMTTKLFNCSEIWPIDRFYDVQQPIFDLACFMARSKIGWFYVMVEQGKKAVIQISRNMASCPVFFMIVNFSC